MNNIFAFGDSIMKGIVMNTSQISDGTVKYTISDQGFVSRVGNTSGVSIRNLSRFGSTILGGLNNLDRHLREIHPGDHVVLEFGGNDCNFDWKAISANPMAVHKPEVSLSQFHDLYIQPIHTTHRESTLHRCHTGAAIAAHTAPAALLRLCQQKPKQREHTEMARWRRELHQQLARTI